MTKKIDKKTALVEPDIIDAMSGRFADWFPGDTWDAWKVILKAAYGMPLSDELGAWQHYFSGLDPRAPF